MAKAPETRKKRLERMGTAGLATLVDYLGDWKYLAVAGLALIAIGMALFLVMVMYFAFCKQDREAP